MSLAGDDNITNRNNVILNCYRAPNYLTCPSSFSCYCILQLNIRIREKIARGVVQRHVHPYVGAIAAAQNADSPFPAGLNNVPDTEEVDEEGLSVLKALLWPECGFGQDNRAVA